MENINTKIDNLQKEKLLEWDKKDNFAEELLNNYINNIQLDLESEDDLAIIEEILKNIITFLESLNNQGSPTGLSEIKDFFDSIIPKDKEETLNSVLNLDSINYDKNTWYPIDRRSLRDRSDMNISHEVEEEYLELTKKTETKEELYSLMVNDRVWDGKVDSSDNTKILEKEFEKYFQTKLEMQRFLIFWPKLYEDLNDSKYIDILNSQSSLNQDELISMYWTELAYEMMKLTNFIKSTDNDKITTLKEWDDFSNKLRKEWFAMLDSVLLFSNDSESNKIKNEILSKIDWLDIEAEEYTLIMAIYWVYVSELHEDVKDISSYKKWLQIFLDSLNNEFEKESFNFKNFVSKLIWSSSTILSKWIWWTKVFWTKLSYFINDLNRIRWWEFFVRNWKEQILEKTLLVTSFIPYIWDCVDIWYGCYKLNWWEDFSWNEIKDSDAWMQIVFWLLWLSLNFMTGVAWSTLKVFLKALPVKVIEALKSGIIWFMKPYIKKISEILSDKSKNIIESTREIKEIISEKILPNFEPQLLKILNKNNIDLPS